MRSPWIYLSIFDLIFRVFVSKRSAYCFVRKVVFVLLYSFSFFRTHVKYCPLASKITQKQKVLSPIRREA